MCVCGVFDVLEVLCGCMFYMYYVCNYRVASGTLHLIRSTVSLNYAARIIIETVDIMRRYGLSGLAGVLMRQDFVEAVETLKKISGIDRMFALSLHELTAGIYYKIAIERGLRGCNPTAEAIAHEDYNFQVYDNNKENDNENDNYNNYGATRTPAPPVSSAAASNPPAFNGSGSSSGNTNTNTPTSGTGIYDVEDGELDNIIEFAPMALEFAYLPSPVDCERLAHAVGYDTLFFHNELQHSSSSMLNEAERPAFVLLASSHSSHTSTSTSTGSTGTGSMGSMSSFPKEKTAILAIRGTQTVQDIVTDIRAEPVSFPPDGECI